MSNLVKKIINEEIEIKSGVLDLSNCGLTTIPEDVFNLIWLTTLVISNENFFHERKGSPNIISEIPLNISKLIKLERLFISGKPYEKWTINDAQILGKLKSLQVLHISNNTIRDISFVKKLANLQELELSGNLIENIDSLVNCSMLQVLDISGNKVTNFLPLKNLTELEKLFLSENSSVTVLSDSSSIINTKNVDKKLDIDILSSLNKLKILDLGSCTLENLPILARLTSLTNLNLSNCDIYDINVLKQNKNLEILNVRDNNIHQLDLDFFDQLEKIRQLYIDGNPLDIPKFIFESTDEDENFVLYNSCSAMKKYINALKEGALKEKTINIYILGNSQTGKSSVKQVITRALNEDSSIAKTINKELSIAYDDQFNYQIWDCDDKAFFSFLNTTYYSNNGLYVVVWDWDTEFNRKATNNQVIFQLNYWLDLKHKLAPQSPLIVLRNKIDDDQNRIYHYDFIDILPTFNLTITDFISISCKTKEGINSLKNRLRDKIQFIREKVFTYQLPANWIKIKHKLQELVVNDNFLITEEQFLEQSRQLSIGDHELVTYLKDYLLKKDSIFYTQNIYDRRIVIEPRWKYKLIYSIFFSKNALSEFIYNKHGILSDSDLDIILSGFNDREKNYIINLLKKTKIAFPIGWVHKGTTSFISSAYLLPFFFKKTPTKSFSRFWDFNNDFFYLKLSFVFLHRNIINECIQYMYNTYDVNFHWDRGLWFCLNDVDICVKFVKEGYEEKIVVQTFNQHLSVAMNVITALYPKVGLREKTDNRLISMDGIRWVNYNKLVEVPKENKQIQTNSGEWVNIEQFPIREKQFLNIPTLNNMKNNRSSIENLIINSQFEEAIDKLFKDDDKSGRRYRHELVIIRNNLEELNRNKNIGVLSFKEESIERNNIVNKLLDIYRKVSNSNLDIEEEKKVKIDLNEELKILFISANPINEIRLQIDKEHRLIKQAIRQGARRDKFRFLQPQLAVTIQELIVAFNDLPEIIHFSGHGTEDGLVITNEQNESQQLAIRPLKRLFKRLDGKVKVVLLNSCYSAEQAREISKFGCHVVGYNLPIGDQAAISFAQGLYIGLGEGKIFDDAFDDAMIVLETMASQYSDSVEVWKDGIKLDL